MDVSEVGRQVSTPLSAPLRWLRAALRGWRWWPESGAASPIPAVDGLRAVAVLLVFAFHAWDAWPGYIQPGQNPYDYPINYGRMGVHLFFVLSGFLLFLPYARWLFGRGGRPSARRFYQRRMLRVGPAYWACLGILGLTLPLTGASGLVGRVGDVALHAAFLSNLTPATLYSINGVFWTMAIEVQFYVLLPVLAIAFMFAARRLGVARGVAAGMLALAALYGGSLLLTRWAATHHWPGALAPLTFLTTEYSSTPFWLAIFGLGMGTSVLYVWLTEIAPRGAVAPVVKQRAGLISLVGGVGLVVALAVLPPLHRLPLKDLLAGLGFALILAGTLFGPPAARAVLTWRPIRFLGLISYSFYLWHAVVLHTIGDQLSLAPGSPWSVLMRAVLIFPVAVLVSYVSYQLVERPFMRSRQRARDITSAAGAPSPVPSYVNAPAAI